MSRIVMLVAAAAAAIAIATCAFADDLPEKLSIGYDQEGHVDASPAACETAIIELVDWSPAEIKEAIGKVCAARQAHIDAYEALQKSYKHFAKVFGADSRLNVATAVEHFERMLKECIDHKTDITTGGHNIAIEIIPNHIATNCLQWGKRMLDDETAWYEQPAEKHTRAAP